jgi:hypothetical protein
MFGLNSYKDEVLNHWFAVADNFMFPPQEFYASVEKRLQERKLPGLQLSRVEYAEGGLLSDKRVYLRLMRERLAFDACASPFGNTYFFSCRTVHSVPMIQLWHLLLMLWVTSFVFGGLITLLGFQFGFIAFITLIGALAWTLRNARVLRLDDIDRTLMNMPVVGPLYERCFRKETYYRHDTRLVYLELVPKIIEELARETTAEKGVKLVRQYELAPIFGGIYKPVTVRQP